MSVLGEFYCPDILNEEHKYSQSGIYKQISPALDHHVSVVCAGSVSTT